MRSHLRATQANHLLNQEIAPVLGKHVVSTDNGIRADSSLDKLAKTLAPGQTGCLPAG